MSSIALYRKYRPNNFNSIIGQKYIVESLKNQVRNQNFCHAYIFSGTRGSGKTTIARIMAKAINCLDNKNGDCCNNCKNCLNIINNDSLDIIEIDAASNSGVEEIRKLIETINYLPTNLKNKIYIIDEAHMLSNSAWNALLKTIEDPPNYINFIFATTEINKIPMTIISRCQRFDFQKLTTSDLRDLINYVCAKENILVSNEVVTKIIQFADGSARDCLSILSQLSTYANNNITIECIIQIFNLTSLDFKIKLINSVFKKDELMLLIKEVNNVTNNYLLLVKEIIDIIVDKLILSLSNNSDLLAVISLSQAHEINLNNDQLLYLLDIFTQAYEKMKLYGNEEFYFKSQLIKIKPFNSLEEQKKPVSNIENQNPIKFDCFTTNEFVIKNVTSPIKKDSNQNIAESQSLLNIDFKQLFKNIASNSNKQKKEEMKQKISTAIGILPHHLQLIENAKVLIASKKAALLMFEFKSEANEFNNLFWNIDNYLSFKENIFDNNDFLLIASDKNTIIQWRSELLNDKNEYPDVDLAIIKKLNKENNIDEKIKSILEIMKEED